MYDCALCAYHKGDIVEAAKNFLSFAEKYQSMELIANAHNVYNYGEFHKGLCWLVSQEETHPTRADRFKGM